MHRSHNIPLNSVFQGPIRGVLTEEQQRRVAAVCERLKGVNTQSYNEMLDGFSRDLDPDVEIKIWERTASLYEKHSPACKTQQGREALFGRLLVTGQVAS